MVFHGRNATVPKMAAMEYSMSSNQNVMPKPNVIYCSFQTRNTIFLCFNDYYRFYNNKSTWVSFDAFYCVDQTFSSNHYTAYHKVYEQL